MDIMKDGKIMAFRQIGNDRFNTPIDTIWIPKQPYKIPYWFYPLGGSPNNTDQMQGYQRLINYQMECNGIKYERIL